MRDLRLMHPPPIPIPPPELVERLWAQHAHSQRMVMLEEWWGGFLSRLLTSGLPPADALIFDWHSLAGAPPLPEQLVFCLDEGSQGSSQDDAVRTARAVGRHGLIEALVRYAARFEHPDLISGPLFRLVWGLGAPHYHPQPFRRFAMEVNRAGHNARARWLRELTRTPVDLSSRFERLRRQEEIAGHVRRLESWRADSLPDFKTWSPSHSHFWASEQEISRFLALQWLDPQLFASELDEVDDPFLANSMAEPLGRSQSWNSIREWLQYAPRAYDGESSQTFAVSAILATRALHDHALLLLNTTQTRVELRGGDFDSELDELIDEIDGRQRQLVDVLMGRADGTDLALRLLEHLNKAHTFNDKSREEVFGEQQYSPAAGLREILGNAISARSDWLQILTRVTAHRRGVTGRCPGGTFLHMATVGSVVALCSSDDTVRTQTWGFIRDLLTSESRLSQDAIISPGDTPNQWVMIRFGLLLALQPDPANELCQAWELLNAERAQAPWMGDRQGDALLSSIVLINIGLRASWHYASGDHWIDQDVGVATSLWNHCAEWCRQLLRLCHRLIPNRPISTLNTCMALGWLGFGDDIVPLAIPHMRRHSEDIEAVVSVASVLFANGAPSEVVEPLLLCDLGESALHVAAALERQQLNDRRRHRARGAERSPTSFERLASLIIEKARSAESKASSET